MSKIEDFENASAGATATNDLGHRALKTVDQILPWTNSQDNYLRNTEMADEGYTLETPAPESAREALDLAWVLAHPVKPGQVIPEGTQYLMLSGDGLMEFAAHTDFKISPGLAPVIRTLEPLPEPEPDWLDAHAVLARHVKHAPDSRPSLWANLGDGLWGHVDTTKRAEVWDLRDVTQLYPKEGQDA